MQKGAHILFCITELPELKNVEKNRLYAAIYCFKYFFLRKKHFT